MYILVQGLAKWLRAKLNKIMKFVLLLSDFISSPNSTICLDVLVLGLAKSSLEPIFRQKTPPGSSLDRTYLIKELDGTCVMAHQREAPTDRETAKFLHLICLTFLFIVSYFV